MLCQGSMRAGEAEEDPEPLVFRFMETKGVGDKICSLLKI